MGLSMLRHFTLIAFMVTSLLVGATEAQSRARYSEEQVKAVFLLNVTHFVTWPDSERNYQNEPFVFCVVGNTRFADELVAVLTGELIFMVQPLVVVCDDPSRVPPCDLLYVDKSVKLSIKEIVNQTVNLSVLTVGDAAEFSREGGGVTLALSDNRIKLQINVDAVRRHGLQVSSKLLQIAKVVGTSSARESK